MRIAYLCSDPGIPVFGTKGAAIHVRELCRALDRLGHEVVVFAARTGDARPADFDVPVHEIAPEPEDRLVADLLRADPDAGEPVAAAVRAALTAVAVRDRARAAIRSFAPDAIYERYALFGTAGLAIAREHGAPLVLEVNAPLAREQATHRGLAFTRTAGAIERTILRAADRVVAVSDALAGWLALEGVAPERVAVLPNGVDAERFAVPAGRGALVRAELGLPAEAPVVGFVGTLKAWHGTATLVRAVAALHRTGVAAPHLLIVGDGPERGRLEALAASEAIAAATRFTGAVPHDRMPDYLSAVDVAVAPYDPTPDFYFSPLKLYEYLAAGRPVVAADVGQARDRIRPGETGLLYPPGSVAGLADAIAAQFAQPAKAAAMARAGQAEVRAHHTWERNARAVVELMETARQPAEVMT